MACMHGGVSRRHAVGAAIAVAGVATLVPSSAYASAPPTVEGVPQAPGHAADTTAATSFDHGPHHPHRLQPPHSGHKRRGSKAAVRVPRAALPCGLGVSKVSPSLI